MWYLAQRIFIAFEGTVGYIPQAFGEGARQVQVYGMFGLNAVDSQ